MDEATKPGQQSLAQVVEDLQDRRVIQGLPAQLAQQVRKVMRGQQELPVPKVILVQQAPQAQKVQQALKAKRVFKVQQDRQARRDRKEQEERLDQQARMVLQALLDR
jgi:hypothetical protein